LPPDPAQQRSIRLLARRVVAGVAPEELPFFDPASDQFFRDRRRRRWRRGDDRVLGYGRGNVIALVTPAALLVASTIVQRLVDRTGDAVIDRSSKLGGRLLRRAAGRWRAHRSPTAAGVPAAATDSAAIPNTATDNAAPGSSSGIAETAPVPVVPAALVPEIRRLVEDAARAAGLPEQRVERFVDEFVGALNIERTPSADAPPTAISQIVHADQAPPADSEPPRDPGQSVDDNH
jgi:hypothetical protein